MRDHELKMFSVFNFDWITFSQIDRWTMRHRPPDCRPKTCSVERISFWSHPESSKEMVQKTIPPCREENSDTNDATVNDWCASRDNWKVPNWNNTFGSCRDDGRNCGPRWSYSKDISSRSTSKGDCRISLSLLSSQRSKTEANRCRTERKREKVNRMFERQKTRRYFWQVFCFRLIHRSKLCSDSSSQCAIKSIIFECQFEISWRLGFANKKLLQLRFGQCKIQVMHFKRFGYVSSLWTSDLVECV